MNPDGLGLAIHKQARSRGWKIEAESGSITRVIQGKHWTVRNITRIIDGAPVPDQTVKYLGGWTWQPLS